MSKYIQRPQVYNAVQYDGENMAEIDAFAAGEEITIAAGMYAVRDPEGTLAVMTEADFLARFAPVPMCDRCEHKDSANNRLAHEVRCTNFDEEDDQ